MSEKEFVKHGCIYLTGYIDPEEDVGISGCMKGKMNSSTGCPEYCHLYKIRRKETAMKTFRLRARIYIELEQNPQTIEEAKEMLHNVGMSEITVKDLSFSERDLRSLRMVKE